MVGNSALGQIGVKPLNFLYRMAGTDDRVRDILTQAMLEPKTAAMLMRNATPQTTLWDRISSGVAPYAQGTAFGLPGAR